jgi:hypothetical protein
MYGSKQIQYFKIFSKHFAFASGFITLAEYF